MSLRSCLTRLEKQGELVRRRRAAAGKDIDCVKPLVADFFHLRFHLGRHWNLLRSRIADNALSHTRKRFSVERNGIIIHRKNERRLDFRGVKMPGDF